MNKVGILLLGQNIQGEQVQIYLIYFWEKNNWGGTILDILLGQNNSGGTSSDISSG